MQRTETTSGDKEPMTFMMTKSGKWVNPETVNQRYNVRDIVEKKRLEAKDRL